MRAARGPRISPSGGLVVLQNSVSCSSFLQLPTFDAPSLVAFAALDAVFLAAVAVPLALLLAGDFLADFLAAVVAIAPPWGFQFRNGVRHRP